MQVLVHLHPFCPGFPSCINCQQNFVFRFAIISLYRQSSRPIWPSLCDDGIKSRWAALLRELLSTHRETTCRAVFFHETFSYPSAIPQFQGWECPTKSLGTRYANIALTAVWTPLRLREPLKMPKSTDTLGYRMPRFFEDNPALTFPVIMVYHDVD